MNESAIKPDYYHYGNIECIDAIESAVMCCNPFTAFCIGNVIKYLWRCGKKQAAGQSCQLARIEDMEKAAAYLARAIDHEKKLLPKETK